MKMQFDVEAQTGTERDQTVIEALKAYEAEQRP